MSPKRKTVILGCVFVFFLASAYLENMFFIGSINHIFANPYIAIPMVFLHNVIVVSLIIIGMTFYVEFVVTFLPKRDIEYAVLHHPRLFACLFTAIILTVSILRVSTFLNGHIVIDLIAIVMLVSLPHGIIEAYGIYRSIHKTLTNSLTTKTLLTIYLIFLLAAILEVAFLQAFQWYIA